MASRASTPSEGEIVEAKATLSRSNTSSPVNRHPRRVLYSRSPSPSISLDPSRARRSRSRSPYRERERGYKRQHEEDHYSRRDREDPRRFRARYEDRHDRQSATSGGRGLEDRRRRSRERRRDSGRLSPPPESSFRGHERSRRDGEESTRAGRDAKKPQSIRDQPSLGAVTVHSSFAAESDTALESKNEVDVDTLREQKRKKWEAIRAKHRSDVPPLLKQALDGHTSLNTAQTKTLSAAPVSPAQVPSDISSDPGTPRSSSSRGSTPPNMDFSDDADLAANHVQGNTDVHEDEPSAADYDATMDMDEDKKRHDYRLQQGPGEAVQSSAQPDPPAESAADEKPAESAKDEFDMFADDGDDDMFAPASDTVNGNGTKGPDKTQTLEIATIDDFDDPEGYYRIILGELLDGRYHVQSNLGKGMFSGVVRAEDKATRRLVAIKIIRANETMRRAAAKEIDILEKLKDADQEDKKHVIRLERSFEHKGHLCMVFENLHENLREVLKKFGRDVGIDLQAVRIYAQQMFKGLGLLRKCNILHADLKPDNILVNERRTLLKICDLGSAADSSENEITPYLVSRFYRAPEIILGMPYDYAIDTWSIGCTLFELYTGKILFTGRTNNQMLRCIMECRGRFSSKMLRKAEFAGLHFDEQGLFRSVERDRVTGNDAVRILNFLKPVRDLRARLMGSSRDTDVNSFLDLLDKCLVLNPERRISPNDALRHPFLARKL